MFRRLLPLTKIVLWVAALYVTFDTLAIRTGFYFSYLEPESIAGSVLLSRTLVEHRLDKSRANVLVLGDSRVGEGFSAKQANEIAKDTKLNFIGCGIPGSTPRVCNYFLRKIDPERTQFSAVVIMTDALTDTEVNEDFVNYKLDLNYCLPLLNWSDLPSFPATFSKPELQERARSLIAFPLAFAQTDIKALLLHPLDRARKASLWRSNYANGTDDYAGQPVALPDLELEGAPLHPRDWADIRESIRPQLRDYIALASGYYPRPPVALAKNYHRLWYEKIARAYQAKGVPVYVFLMPRGPYHTRLGCPTALAGSLADLSAEGIIRFIPPERYAALEVPGNFFDQLHMNSAGRAQLTDLLAHALMEQKL